MKASRYPFEHYIYWLAFLLGLGLRLIKLGAGPLADPEASLALQALSLAHGQPITLGAQPAYILLTSALFSLLGSTTFLARLFPALAGSLLVWLPFYFRPWMGGSSWLQRAGLVLAFGLAIDPGLVSISRQAGGLMPAVAFTLVTLAAFYNRRMVWVGIFAGVALLSGPSFLQGLVMLLVLWGLLRLVLRKLPAEAPDSGDESPLLEPSPSPPLRKAIPSFVLTWVVAGALFLRAPQGLGALADTLPAYLNTWVVTSGVPALRLPASLPAYQPLVVIFALLAIFRWWFGKQDDSHVRPLVVGLSLGAAVTILFPLLYAGRQVPDMTWALIPLWSLAALEISQSLRAGLDKLTTIVAACLAFLLFVLAVVGWINLLAIGRYQANVALYWAIIIGSLLLGLIGVLLVAAGWSIRTATIGVVMSLCLAFGLQLLATSIGMSIVRHNSTQELWAPAPTTGQADLLLSTLSDFSSWNTGQRDQLQIVALDAPPSLQWALRQYPNASFQSTLSSSTAPPVVITLKGAQAPILAQQYRGQDFVWTVSPGWQGVFPPDFINWLAFRSAPLNQGQVILWARADIFPGGAPVNTSSTTP
jgi:hypothetical protein